MSTKGLSTTAARELVDHFVGEKQVPVFCVRDFDEAGIQIDDIALRRPTLDDVFLSLTGHVAEEKPEAEAAPAGRNR